MKQNIPLLCVDRDALISHCSGKDVILFGSGLFIRPAIHSLKQAGIEPVRIYDNSPGKHGTEIYGIKVVKPEKRRENAPAPTIIITAAPCHIDSIRSQLMEMGYSDIFDCAPLLASFEYCQDTFEYGASKLNNDLDRYAYEYLLKFYPGKVIIPSLDVVVTEKCSLRCRDCANLMQYYTSPKDIDHKLLFEAIDILMQCVDHVLEFRILGGEAFMNRNMWRIVNGLRKYGNYTRIAVYSNGTIIPTGENLNCLIHDDTFMRISDYGVLSRKIPQMIPLLNEHGVIYSVLKCDKWQDCAEIRNRNRPPGELEATFTCCCAKTTFTLLRDKVYACPFAANADNLHAIPSFPNEMLVINERIGKNEIREQLINMLRTRKYFSACNYCAGRNEELTPLDAAVQAADPLAYNNVLG